MALHVKRVGIIKHEVWCDNIWEYLSVWVVLLTFSALVAMGGVALIRLFAA